MCALLMVPDLTSDDDRYHHESQHSNDGHCMMVIHILVHEALDCTRHCGCGAAGAFHK